MVSRCRINIGSDPPIDIELEIEEHVSPSYLTEFVSGILNKSENKNSIEVEATEAKTEVNSTEAKTEFIESDKVDIPSKNEIEEFIRSKPDYEHASTEILEEMCGVTFEKYSEIRKNRAYSKAMDDIIDICREIRDKIAKEENGRWTKKQKRLKGKYRHVHRFNGELGESIDNQMVKLG